MAGNKTIGSILIGIGLESSKFQKELKNLEYSLGRTAKKWQSYGQEMSMAISVPVIAAAGLAVKAFAEEEQAVIKLNSAIKANGKDVAKIGAQYKDFASEMQRLTVVEDDAVISALQLAESMKLANPQQAVQGAIGLSRAFGIDLDTALKATAKGMNGQYTALQKLIPSIKLAGSDTEKAALFQNILNDSFKLAQDETTSTAGSILQLKNQLSDLSEEFGSLIAQYLKPFIERLKEVIKYFKDLSPESKQLIITLSLIAAGIGPVVFGIGKIIQAGSGLIGIFRGLTAVSVASGGWITLAVVSLGYLIANWSDLNKLVSDAKTDIDELNVKTGFWKDLNLALADTFYVIKAVSGTFFDWYSNKVALITGETQDSLSLFEIAFGYGKKIVERFTGTRPAKATTIEGFQIPFVPYQGNYYEGNSGTFIPPKEKELLGGLGDVTKTATKGSIEWLNQEVTKLTNKLRENNLTPGGMLDTIKQIVNYEGQIKKLEDKIQSIKDSLLPRQAVGVVAPISTNIKPVQAAGLNLPTPEIIENTQSKLVNLTGALTTMANDGLMAATAGFTDMFAAMATGGDIAAAFNGLLLGLMDVLSQFAQVAIATGLASDGIKKALQLNPYAAIAGGIALLALTKIVKASLSNISKKQIPGYASGGIFTDESLIRVGEYAGASSNPEVVAPLDKLKDMLRLNGSAPMQLSIVIDSRLQGSDLMQSIKRTESKYSRM